MSDLPLLALVGNPNTGKTALFNALTGARQKVANYPGVTVERKEGLVPTSSGDFSLLDLPGTLSLDAKTLDEEVTRKVILGEQAGERVPQAIICVADATNLRRNLAFILEIKDLGIPSVLALNMHDLAHAAGIVLDLETLSRELGMPVVPTVAVKNRGLGELVRHALQIVTNANASSARAPWSPPQPDDVRRRFAEVDRILAAVVRDRGQLPEWSARLDRAVLHPFWGNVFLLALLFLMFQSIFSWAEAPMDAIESGIGMLSQWASSILPAGVVASLVTDGIIAGVGSVLVFLPQILILFLFILLMEDSGYMARAAFLMDLTMKRVGLHGRAFLPLISSHACAIPGVMSARTIENPRDRITTILMAPLTTCSARLPVYTLLIAAFIPDRQIGGVFNLQGLVMMGLYLTGIVSALVTGFALKRTLLKGEPPVLLMELPTYKIPSVQNVSLGLYERGKTFVKRAGTMILAITMILWFLASYPKPPLDADATTPAIHYSYAGRIGHAIEPLIRPLGFDWRVGTSLVPGFAAREVMVSALATVYAIEDEGAETALATRLASEWTLATGLSLIAWYIFAPQCLATLAVMRRETNSWRWPLLSFAYMLGLAYLASFVVYHVTLYLSV